MRRVGLIVGFLAVVTAGVFGGLTIHQLQSKVDHLGALQVRAEHAQSTDHAQVESNASDSSADEQSISDLQLEVQKLERSVGASSPYGVAGQASDLDGRVTTLQSQVSNVQQALEYLCTQLNRQSIESGGSSFLYVCD